DDAHLRTNQYFQRLALEPGIVTVVHLAGRIDEQDRPLQPQGELQRGAGPVADHDVRVVQRLRRAYVELQAEARLGAEFRPDAVDHGLLLSHAHRMRSEGDPMAGAQEYGDQLIGAGRSNGIRTPRGRNEYALGWAHPRTDPGPRRQSMTTRSTRPLP